MTTLPQSRSTRAVALVASGALDDSVAIYLDPARTQRLVPSQSKEGAFYVTSANSCTCPDATYRKAVCKHQQAVRVARVLAAAEQENVHATDERRPLGRVIPAAQIERED
jgi:uncharacterized Zn finger protein